MTVVCPDCDTIRVPEAPSAASEATPAETQPSTPTSPSSPHEAIMWLFLACLEPSGQGWHELHAAGEPSVHPAGDHTRLQSRLDLYAREFGEVWISAAPRKFRKPGSVVMATGCVWAKVEGKRSGGLLAQCGTRRLKIPEPTLVIREGQTQRLTAMWCVSRPLSYAWAKRANRRVAAALRMPAGKACDPNEFMIRVPGSEVRGKRGATPVRVVECREVEYRPAEVVGRLRDAPEWNGQTNGREH